MIGVDGEFCGQKAPALEGGRHKRQENPKRGPGEPGPYKEMVYDLESPQKMGERLND